MVGDTTRGAILSSAMRLPERRNAWRSAFGGQRSIVGRLRRSKEGRRVSPITNSVSVMVLLILQIIPATHPLPLDRDL